MMDVVERRIENGRTARQVDGEGAGAAIRIQIVNRVDMTRQPATERHRMMPDEEATVAGNVLGCDRDGRVDKLPSVHRRHLSEVRPRVGDQVRRSRRRHDELLVRGVVVLIARRGVIRADVLQFTKVDGARVQSRVEISMVDLNPSIDEGIDDRWARRRVRKETGDRVHFGARPEKRLVAVE